MPITIPQQKFRQKITTNDGYNALALSGSRRLDECGYRLKTAGFTPTYNIVQLPQFVKAYKQVKSEQRKKQQYSNFFSFHC